MKKRGWTLIVLCVGIAAVPLLSGCNNDSPPIQKDSFKRGEMPPEAQKGMADAMKKASAPPTGH